MATKKPDPLLYQIADARTPAGPQSGYLYALHPRPNEAYIANSVRKHIDTGIVVAVPEGVTVEIEGLYDLEAKGVKVTPRRLVGPTPPERLYVALSNEANATVPLSPDTPIASIRAYKSVPLIQWQEHEPPTDSEEERATRGERDAESVTA